MSFNLTEKDNALEIAKAKLQEARWWQEAICARGDIKIPKLFDLLAIKRIYELEKEVAELSK